MDFNKIKETYLATFRKYVDFSGRADRAEFWTFFFVNFVISMVLSYMDTFVSGSSFTGAGYLSSIFSLIILLPSLGVSVRRLHDIGKSGGWIFITIILFIGWIWILILWATEGNSGSNEYGPDPKGINPHNPINIPPAPEIK